MKMWVSFWQDLLDTVSVSDGGLVRPCGSKALDDCEVQLATALPQSYRAYCQVFGPGEIGGVIDIAAPGVSRSEVHSLEGLNHLAQDLEADVYSKNLAQHKRSTFF